MSDNKEKSEKIAEILFESGWGDFLDAQHTGLLAALPKIKQVLDKQDVVAFGALLTPDQATGTESEVCADIAKRQAFGLSKYGMSVEDNPLHFKEWLQHAYEESLDLSIYLKRAMSELKKQGEQS